MYETQKQRFEENLIRSELEPTQGGWFITPIRGWCSRPGRWIAVDGKCCALSPTIIIDMSMIPGGLMEQLSDIFHIHTRWLDGAIAGFDRIKSDRPRSADAYYIDGFAWGLYMRDKYVRRGGLTRPGPSGRIKKRPAKNNKGGTNETI